jgi:hypothetical protein
MKINKYTDFINESKLELLLEANIKYTDNFITVLKDINSELSGKILNLNGKEVDVNTNYIDIDKDKEDVIKFIPENKLKSLKIKVISIGYSYDALSKNLEKDGRYPIKNARIPTNGSIGQVVKDLTADEMANLSNSSKTYWRNIYLGGSRVVHFRYTDENGEGEIIMGSKGLDYQIEEIPKSEIGVGRFVRRILDKAGEKVSDKDLEEFVNKYKSLIQIRKEAFTRFKIVSGEEIRYFYLSGNYANMDGTLGNSCMRYGKCQKFLDIYVGNSEQVKMIVLMSKKDETSITGRALLWTDNLGRKIMDRVYTNNSADETLFKEYAIKNEFLYKERQDSNEDTNLLLNGKEVDEQKAIIELPSFDYNYYPYMDTFKNYNPSTGKLSNSNDGSYDYNLEETDGGNGSCDTCGGRGRVECYDCSGDGEVSCSECDGNGNTRCDDCGGEGQHECGECDASSEINCSNCDGSGRVEDEEGNETDCDDCSASGKVDCPDCKEGYIKCEECRGDGEIGCTSCDERGQVECYTCDGNGRADCPECG